MIKTILTLLIYLLYNYISSALGILGALNSLQCYREYQTKCEAKQGNCCVVEITQNINIQ